MNRGNIKPNQVEVENLLVLVFLIFLNHEASNSKFFGLPVSYKNAIIY